MEIQDTPIHTKDKVMEDSPVMSSYTKPTSQETDSFEAGQAAMLDSYVTGNSVMDNYKYYSGVLDKKSELERLSQQKADIDSSAVEEELVNNPYGVTGSVQETANAAYLATQEALKQGTDPDRQFVESLVGDTVDMSEVAKQTARTKMFKLVADTQEEVDGWDVAADFAVSILPFYESIRGGRLTGKYLNQEGMIKQAIVRFQNKPVEEQAELLPYLKEHLEETVGKVHAAGILSNFVKTLGSENPQGFSNAEKVFDAMDATILTLPFSWALKGLKQSSNVVKTAKALKNDKLAVEANMAAASDPEIAKSAGISQDTAAGNMYPFDISETDLGHVSGLSGKHLEELEGFIGRVDKLADDIIAGNGFLKEGVLNTAQRAKIEADTLAKLKAEKAENITFKEKDPNTTTFTYQVLDEEGNLSDKTYELNLSLNDAGMYEQSEIGLTGQLLGSPSAWARGALREDVQTAQRIDYLNDRLNKQFMNSVVEAMRPIGLIPTKKNKASLAKVDNALIQGDEWKNADGTRGKIFTPDELRRDFKLEDNEISAYFRINRLYNNLHRIRNHEIRQERLAKGYKGVTFTRNSEMMDGKPFETPNDANFSLMQSNTNYVYDADLDEIVNIRGRESRLLSDVYDNDKKIVRLSSPYDVGGNRGKVNYAIVNNDEIGELPQQVIPRKDGYVARIYKDNAYFVKEIFEETVDGDKTVSNKKTLRFFDNKKEADQYVEQLVQKEIAKVSEENAEKMAAYNKKKAAYDKSLERYNQGKRKTKPKEPTPPKTDAKVAAVEAAARAKYKRLSDREEEILSSSTGDVGNGTGGLYTGARAQDDILFGLNGDKPSRLNSFESLTRNIGNLSKFVSINQWRMGLEQRWINTANRIFKDKGINVEVEHFQRLASSAETKDEVRFLNKVHDQIRDWQSFATTEEQAWAATVQKAYDQAADKGMKRTARMLGNLRDIDPIATARATAFHSLLGWFNFSQLWVQAQGAMIAASLGAGKYLTKTIGQTTSLHMLDVGGDFLKKASGNIAKASGMSEKELVRFHDLWRKTGYFDSVKQTADHAAVSKGYGMSVGVLKKMSDEGLIFYRAGELTNRRVSFSTAMNRWLEKNPSKGILDVDDKSLKAIMDDANAMMLGMTKGNRAAWQKGVFSLPTQFLQVTTKFLETAGGFNKNFTPAERGRMIASQLVLYGTAGIPLMGLGNKMAMEAFGITQQDIDDNPGIAKSWNDGLWGATTFWVLGADIEMASRGSLLRGVSDFVDTWFVQESTMADKFLGAFGSTNTRFWDSFTHYMKPFTLGSMSTIRWEDGAKLLTMPFLDSISTSRNIIKAEYMQRLDAIYSSTGRLHDTRDYSFMEEWAVRLGFQHTKDVETWDITERTQAADALKKSVTEYVMKEMNTFALKYPQGGYSDKEFEDYHSRIQVAMGVLYPDEAKEVNEAIFNSITSGSRRSQAIRRAHERIKSSLTGEAMTWKATLLGNGILRVGEPTEEQE